MIQEDTMVRVARVVPWTKYPECPKCGSSLGAGNWLLRLLYAAKGNAAQNYVYCQGDQNSTVQVAGMEFRPDGPRLSVQECAVHCFGVYEEHIHLACGRCQWKWLMAVKP